MEDDYNFDTPLTKENCYDQMQKAWNSDKVWNIINMMIIEAQYSQAMDKIRRSK